MLLGTALLHFEEDIGRAAALHAYAAAMPAGVLRDDVLRAAWMMAVGACDAYFSDAYADLVSRTLQARTPHPAMAIPDRMNNLRIPVVAVLRESRVYGGWRWRMAARELIEDENVLSLKKIKELFNQFFPDGGKLMTPATIEPWILHHEARVRQFGTSRTAYRALAHGARGSARSRALDRFQAYYAEIFQRRHDCIHNCDRPKVALQTVSATTVAKRVEDIRFLVRRCHADLLAAFPLYLRRCAVPGAVHARVGAGGGARRPRRTRGGGRAGSRRSARAGRRAVAARPRRGAGPVSGAGGDPSRPSFYDGRTVILPDVARMLPGDVLLTRTTKMLGPAKAVQSEAIRRRTGGSFSHALICSEPPVMVEAVGTGVSTLTLARCYAHEWASVRMLRHPDAALAQAAASAAQLQVGRDYSVRRALRSAFPAIADRVADLGTFCSALVAQSFVGAGDAWFARVPVERTTPATIEAIEGLEDVTRLLFHEGPAPRNIGRLVPLDAHHEPLPSARQTEISGRYAKALMADAELVAAALPGATEIVPTHWGMIDVAMDAMDAVDDGAVATTLAGDLGRLDARLAEMISSGELASVYAALEAIEGEGLQQAVRASFDPAPDIDLRAMRAQLGTTVRTLEVRRRSVGSMDAWNAGGRSAAVAAHAALERAAIRGMERRRTLFAEILTRLA